MSIRRRGPNGELIPPKYPDKKTYCECCGAEYDITEEEFEEAERRGEHTDFCQRCRRGAAMLAKLEAKEDTDREYNLISRWAAGEFVRGANRWSWITRPKPWLLAATGVMLLLSIAFPPWISRTGDGSHGTGPVVYSSHGLRFLLSEHESATVDYGRLLLLWFALLLVFAGVHWWSCDRGKRGGSRQAE